MQQAVTLFKMRAAKARTAAAAYTPKVREYHRLTAQAETWEKAALELTHALAGYPIVIELPETAETRLTRATPAGA
jgi:hypothetical protein